MRSLVAPLVLAILGCSASPTEPATRDASGLTRASSCEELLSALQSDAILKMNETLDAQIDLLRRGLPVGNPTPKAGVAGPGVTTDLAAVGDRAGSYSNTNTQVQGVDEADFAKTDGRRLYLLHGGEFLVLPAFPATELRIASRTAIEGVPREMFVFDAKAVIYSDVDGTSVYAQSGLSPRQNFPEANLALADGSSPAPAPSAIAKRLTKVTVLSLSGSQTTTTAEFYFEGTYLSSRRSLSRVRTVLSGTSPGPQILYRRVDAAPNADEIAALEALRSQNTALLRASTIADWLPRRFVRRGAQLVVDQIACENVHYPARGTTQHGLVTVETMDGDYLDQLPSETAIVGAVDTVYENSDTLLLAGRTWVDPNATLAALPTPSPVGPDAGTSSDGGSLGPQALHLRATGPVIAGSVLNGTSLHAFDIRTGQTRYTASTVLPGTIRDQYSLDIRGTDVRAVSTVLAYGARSTTNFVRVGLTGRGFSVPVTVADEVPGDRVRSVRFIDARAFASTDSGRMLSLDLSGDKPAVTGRDDAFGPVDFMLPIDESRVVTFGPNAADHSKFTLQLLNMSNPQAPVRQPIFEYSNVGSSTAQLNPKAVSYSLDRQLLTFPYAFSNTVAGTTDSVASRLEVFRLGKTIAKVGDVNHSAYFTPTPTASGCFFGLNFSPEVRRGLVLEENIYTISYGAITVHAASNFVAPIAQVVLSAPTLVHGSDGKDVCIE